MKSISVAETFGTGERGWLCVNHLNTATTSKTCLYGLCVCVIYYSQLKACSGHVLPVGGDAGSLVDEGARMWRQSHCFGAISKQIWIRPFVDGLEQSTLSLSEVDTVANGTVSVTGKLYV